MKGILIGIVIVVAIVGGYMLLNTGGPAASPTPTALSTATPNATTTPSVSKTPIATVTATPAASAVKTFNVTGKSFSFSPTEIKVKKGDTVKIVFKNDQGSHDWVIDEFKARTKVLSGGQTETIQFVADKTGTFEYYCSVGTHRQMGMKGKLIVE